MPIPNAKKWTPEVINKHLDAVDRMVKEERDCYFLGRALAAQGLGRHVWSYWKRIFAEDDDMLDRMSLIEGRFEVKVFKAGLHREIPPSMAIWILKYVHHWGRKDRDTMYSR
jgi:hypothetical protein